MGQNYKIELNFTLEDGTKSGAAVIEDYGTQVHGYLNQIARNQCDCDEKVLSERFSNLVIEHWTVTQRRRKNHKVTASFTVNAESEDFVRQVFHKLMDGFADSMTAVMNDYYTKTGERPRLNPLPSDWEMEIK